MDVKKMTISCCFFFCIFLGRCGRALVASILQFSLSSSKLLILFFSLFPHVRFRAFSTLTVRLLSPGTAQKTGTQWAGSPLGPNLCSDKNLRSRASRFPFHATWAPTRYTNALGATDSTVVCQSSLTSTRLSWTETT
ncbi:hypothetical protein CI102_9752 [Trichoderma harzianum]|nr:hypothetical protein CI102_9752 [Trichoderma harzianum]